jgi:hypothetical protein
MSNGPIIEDFQLIQDNDDDNDARLKDKSRKRVSRACVYCQRSHMSCDEGRPCKRCLSRGMGELCRDGKCKRRGRKRKSELTNSADEEELSTDSVEKKVSAPRGRPRKVSPFANPAQMSTGQRFEYGERPMYITSQAADAVPPTLAVVTPQQQQTMTMGMDPRIQYYIPNPVMAQVKQQQQQPRVEVTVNENSMGSVFSSYNMYPSVPVPMFGNSQNYAKYEESCDPSIFLTGDYPPGLIESSNDLFDFGLLALTE